MREKIDPKLKKEWESRLSEFGLGEELDGPKRASSEEEEALSAEHLISEKLLKRFAGLPGKIREDILEDVRKGHQAEESLVEISERTEVLIAKAEELVRINNNSSDRQYNEIGLEEKKLKWETDTITIADEFLQQMEILTTDKDGKEKIH